jgi:hypothetical protein
VGNRFVQAGTRISNPDCDLTAPGGPVSYSPNAKLAGHKLMKLIHAQAIVKTSLLCAAVSLLAAGCASQPAPPTRGSVVPWTIKITKVTPASVEVDLFGVNKTDDAYWRNSVQMDTYWKPKNAIRQSVINRAKTTRFDAPGPFVLDSKDPIWATWSNYGSYELAIMANLPGNFPNPAADPRRLFLPLGKKEWEAKGRTLEIEILEGQIRVLTPPRP